MFSNYLLFHRFFFCFVFLYPLVFTIQEPWSLSKRGSCYPPLLSYLSHLISQNFFALLFLLSMSLSGEENSRRKARTTNVTAKAAKQPRSSQRKRAKIPGQLRHVDCTVIACISTRHARFSSILGTSSYFLPFVRKNAFSALSENHISNDVKMYFR